MIVKMIVVVAITMIGIKIVSMMIDNEDEKLINDDSDGCLRWRYR